MSTFPCGLPDTAEFSINPALFDPIFHCPLDGDLIDVIGGRSPTAISGTPTYAPGVGGRKCLALGGASMLAYTGDNSPFQVGDLTVAYWAYEKGVAYGTHFAIASPTNVDADDNTVLQIVRWINGSIPNYLQLASATGDRVLSNKSTSLSAVQTQLHHILVSRTSGVYSGYIDGHPLFTTPPSAVTVTPGSNAQLTIGAQRVGANYMDGTMQSVMFWDKALTDAQQQAIVAGVGLTVRS